MVTTTELTEKQAEVMAYVYQGLASKEIARLLNIAPATVDQRADGARRKLGAATRMEAARIYATKNGIPERVVYEPFPLTHHNDLSSVTPPLREQLRFEDAGAFDERAPWDRGQPWRLPEFQPRDLGAVGRIVVIVGLAVLILLVVTEGLRLSHGLGLMFSR